MEESFCAVLSVVLVGMVGGLNGLVLRRQAEVKRALDRDGLEPE